MLSSLFGGKAKAQVADYVGTGGTSTSITYYSNESGTVLQKTGLGSNSACGSGGLSGMTNDGVTTFSTSNGRIYFKVTPNSGYVINVSSFTAKLRRSGSGIQKVRFAYSLDNGSTWTNDATDHAPDNSGCGSSATTQTWGSGSLPTGVTSTNGVIFAMFPYAPISNGGTIQVNEIHIGGAIVAGSCSGTPTAGSVSASPTSLCGSGSSLLTLSGASGGTGITYQWASSSDNITFSNISGATNNTYNASLSSTTYYRATTTCTTSTLSATTASTAVTVNTVPSVAPITGTTLVNIGTPSTLADATAGGAWSSSNTAVGTINASGVVTGIAPGSTNVTYTVTSGSCSASVATVVSVIAPGTLAVYSGAGGNGTGTSTVGIANETVSTLGATGFGANSPCTTGGLSGITVSTTVATYSASGPHVYYQILPNSGYQLNVTGISAVTRESGTGPQKARIAYSLDGGATWTSEGVDVSQATGGSCGASSNSWSYTGGLTVMGITSTTNGIIVAVYPYNPSASTGTFQLKTLTVFGNVAPAGSCTGTTGGTAVAAPGLLCASGVSTVSLTGGSTGTGISYQWQSSADGISFSDISGATNTSYNTATLTSTTYYQVVTSCSFAGTPSTSSVATVTVNPIPAPGSITGVPSYVIIGTPSTLGATVAGGTWSSNHVGVATVGSSDGIVNGLIPGSSVITYRVTSGGCSDYTTAIVGVLHPNTLAAYIGEDGNSVATIAFGGVSTTLLTASGFGTNSPCGTGGISGLTNDGVTSFSTANASVSFKVTATPGGYFNVGGFHVTLRRSNSGITKVRMAYSTDNGASWNDDGVDQAPDNSGCANSSTDFTYSATLPSGVSAAGDGVIFALYPYDPIANGGTIQVNAIDIVGTVNACIADITGGNTAICVGVGGAIGLADATAGGTWSSSDDGIATVGSADGVVTGVTAGVVTISYTATTPCGESVATTTITVNPVPSVDAITGNDNVICGIGGTLTLSDETAGGVWSSDDETVATVGTDGVVTGTGIDRTNINYTVTNEFGCSASASVEVTVNALPAVDPIEGAGEAICEGNTLTLTDATSGGSWSSSNTTVATIGTDGVVNGLAAGHTTISYIVGPDPYGCTNTVTVDVEVVQCGGGNKGVAHNSAAAVTNITINPNPATSVLHISGAEKVNASVISVDGKLLIQQTETNDVNVGSLVPGVYIIRVYSLENSLIKTARFTKE